MDGDALMAFFFAAHEPKAMHEVQDSPTWHVFDRLFGGVDVPLPKLFSIAGHDVYLTKFMILELVVALLIIAIYVPIARRAASGELPRGPWWNAFESLLTFIRNEIARPTLGAHHPHEADKFVPYLWTVFLFILFCNLFGLIPLMGSPTASIWVTAGLALCSFVMMHGAPIAKMGVGHYLKSLWPHIDVPYVGWLFSGMIFTIELIGTFVKAFVLAVRLFANMFGGHMVLATILIFVYQAGKAGFGLWASVTLASVLGNTALCLLELLVAFIQAYVFTFLTALFMGMALNPQH
jgi:F-type H+-transporting ATPase subunit a